MSLIKQNLCLIYLKATFSPFNFYDLIKLKRNTQVKYIDKKILFIVMVFDYITIIISEDLNR